MVDRERLPGVARGVRRDVHPLARGVGASHRRRRDTRAGGRRISRRCARPERRAGSRGGLRGDRGRPARRARPAGSASSVWRPCAAPRRSDTATTRHPGARSTRRNGTATATRGVRPTARRRSRPSAGFSTHRRFLTGSGGWRGYSTARNQNVPMRRGKPGTHTRSSGTPILWTTTAPRSTLTPRGGGSLARRPRAVPPHDAESDELQLGLILPADRPLPESAPKVPHDKTYIKHVWPGYISRPALTGDLTGSGGQARRRLSGCSRRQYRSTDRTDTRSTLDGRLCGNPVPAEPRPSRVDIRPTETPVGTRYRGRRTSDRRCRR